MSKDKSTYSAGKQDQSSQQQQQKQGQFQGQGQGRQDKGFEKKVTPSDNQQQKQHGWSNPNTNKPNISNPSNPNMGKGQLPGRNDKK